MLGEHVAAGHGNAAAVGAQHDGNALAGQGLRRGDRLVGLGLVVHDDQLHIIGGAADLDGGGQGIGVLNAQDLLLAAGAVVAGSGLKHADLHGLGHGRRAEDQHHCQNDCQNFLHRK